MKEVKLSLCTRQNTCFDCDNTECFGHGGKGADCPKLRCDNPGGDCDDCEFINNFIDEMREEYGRSKT